MIIFLSDPSFSCFGESTIAELIPNFFQLPSGEQKPAIKLSTGQVVTCSSKEYLDPAGAAAYAATYTLALQTGDIAIQVRNELDKNPLNTGTSVDGSDSFQRLSDIAIFFLQKDEPWMAMCDPVKMFGQDYAKHAELAKQIGRGLELQLCDELAVRILDTAGNRKVKLPENYWTYSIPTHAYAKNNVALTVFPLAAQAQEEYLARNGWKQGRIYFFDEDLSDISDILSDDKTAAIRPFCMGGHVGRASNIDALFFSDEYIGRARGYVPTVLKTERPLA